MYGLIPYTIFSIFVLSGFQPRVAMVASDAILWPTMLLIEHARTYPCVVYVDKHGNGEYVDGPPSPGGYGPFPFQKDGYTTHQCTNYNAADSRIVHWSHRGMWSPLPPWRTIPCAINVWCHDTVFYVEDMPIPWPN